MTRILAIAAHPDDECIGCGGLLQRGTDRRIVVLSHGEKGGPYPLREAEAMLAALALNASISIYECQDTNINLNEAIKILEDEIAEYRPDMVLTLPGQDTHQDHRVTAFATEVAVRDLCGTVLAYCSPSAASKWEPNWFVALTEEEMARKVKAAQCHKSQSDRSYMAEDYIRGTGRHWAQVTRSKAPYVEPYALVRMRER